jgi:hypothetical protein
MMEPSFLLLASGSMRFEAYKGILDSSPLIIVHIVRRLVHALLMAGAPLRTSAWRPPFTRFIVMCLEMIPVFCQHVRTHLERRRWQYFNLWRSSIEPDG